MAFYVTLGEDERTDNDHYNSFHDIGSAMAKVLAMFTGELGFETAFTTSTSFAEDPMYSMFVFILYLWFIFEMCVILMNLLIGLAISNIQDMRVNADALRLVKEVLLQVLTSFKACRRVVLIIVIYFQRYMESLLRLSTMPYVVSFCKENCALGKLVCDDIFNSVSIYTLNQHNSGTYDNKMVLSLVTNSNNNIETDEDGITVPGTVVAKLKQLFQGMQKAKEEKGQQLDVRKILNELKEEIAGMKKFLETGTRHVRVENFGRI